MRDHCPNEKFAVACARDRAGRVVRISAGANDRRITHPTRKFIGCPASRSCGGQVSLRVPRHRTDRAVRFRLGNNELFTAFRGRLLRRL